MAIKKSADRSKSELLQARFSQKEAQKCAEIAKATGKTKAEILREAFQRYANDYDRERLDERETKIDRRLDRMERYLETMRLLLVKDIRISGQTLYFAALPFQKGPPQKALSQEGFKNEYEKSRALAAQFLLVGRKSSATPEASAPPDELDPDE